MRNRDELIRSFKDYSGQPKLATEGHRLCDNEYKVVKGINYFLRFFKDEKPEYKFQLEEALDCA